ncbi:MAG: LAGLIDADG family homing endonuclease [Gammaproteobacteria bacterium]|nr:LAGLIDADG family homing endonuclease [Gammaproteobacteria bacterium]
MKRDKKSLVAYASGLFDGEGCIYSFTNDGGKRIATGLSINMSTHEWVDLFVGLFGGNVFFCVPVSGDCGRLGSRPTYSWRITNITGIHKTLKLMLPFLRVKQEQAQLMIRLCDRKIVGIRKHNKFMRERNGFKTRIENLPSWEFSEHELDKRNELHERIKALKKFTVGIPKCIDQSEHQRIIAAVENKQNDNAKTVVLTLKLCSDPSGK